MIYSSLTGISGCIKHLSTTYGTWSLNCEGVLKECCNKIIHPTCLFLSGNAGTWLLHLWNMLTLQAWIKAFSISSPLHRAGQSICSVWSTLLPSREKQRFTCTHICRAFTLQLIRYSWNCTCFQIYSFANSLPLKASNGPHPPLLAICHHRNVLPDMASVCWASQTGN